MSEEHVQSSNFTCGKEALHEYQFTEIKEVQRGILETQEQFNERIKSLENNKIQMTMEFQNLKQSQSEQKILMLDLDRISRENNDKKFEKILSTQDKNEDKNDKLFSAQTELLTKIVDNQNVNASGRIEITKGKIAIIIALITAIVTLVPIIVEKFL